MKTSEIDAQYSNFNMGEMDKSREMYSREGDNSSRFVGKKVAWEHTILTVQERAGSLSSSSYI